VSWGKRIGFLAALIVFVLGAMGLVSFINFSSNTKSEYVAADVIRSTTTYVKTNNGRWPRSWKELGEPGTNAFVLMNFKLTRDAILQNPELLETAIQPRTKRWMVYPHHKRDLAELFEAIKGAQP